MRKLAAISIISILMLSVPLNAFALTNGQGADRVLGQAGFTTANSPSPPTPVSLKLPFSVTIDSVGDLWVADSSNNRVLRYDCPCSNGQTAAMVLGQPNPSTGTINTGGISASSLFNPTSVAVDMAGNVWVTDQGNNRVLKYNIPTLSLGEAADLVLGQPDFSSGSFISPTASSLGFPIGVTVESDGDVWVDDTDNNRVLKYNAPTSNGEAADLVLGQPDFTTGTANNGGISASSLFNPRNVKVESDGDVWVADHNNNRVLKYNNPTAATGEAADLVLGQTLFTTGTSGTTASTLSGPLDVTVDSTGSVWVADFNNHRVLRYGATTSASQTQGQASILGTCGLSFVSGAPINYGSLTPGATSLEQTLVLDNTGNTDATLFVKGGNWVDITVTTIITVDKTKFSTTSGTYASKTPLALTDQSLGTITSATNLNTFWQLLADVLSPSFTGGVTQTMDFTASC